MLKKFSKFDSKQYKLYLLIQAHIIASCPWVDPEVVKGGDGNSSKGLANREVRVQLMFIGIIEVIL